MDETIIEKYSKPTPRYTSYPTAPHFHADITPQTYRDWLSDIAPDQSVSLYLHIPFCDRLCWFCGCNTKQTNRYKPIKRYLGSLKSEICQVSTLLHPSCKVTAIHLGGGSPTMLEPDDLKELSETLYDRFNVTSDVEFSVEMDPNDLTTEKYDSLAKAGVTRVSLGVQDFNEEVQNAINRPQSFEQTKGVVEAMRSRGVRSVNLDMLYGLPHQTLETVERTARLIVSLKPERIALFGYAHVPWFKKHQRMINESALPDSLQRFEQAKRAAELFQANGYQRIGIDHFALADDTLAKACAGGVLKRNFQGYTDDDAQVLVGLGASAIGKLPQGYVQNMPATGEYQKMIETGLATSRGLAFSQEDRMRGWVIERLMCDFEFSSKEMLQRFGSGAKTVLAEAQTVACCDVDGIVTKTPDGRFGITEAGKPFVRSIAAQFDPYFRKGVARHSVSV